MSSASADMPADPLSDTAPDAASKSWFLIACPCNSVWGEVVGCASASIPLSRHSNWARHDGPSCAIDRRNRQNGKTSTHFPYTPAASCGRWRSVPGPWQRGLAARSSLRAHGGVMTPRTGKVGTCALVLTLSAVSECCIVGSPVADKAKWQSRVSECQRAGENDNHLLL